MSLELAARHLASKGRGPDTALVHMAPSEVHTLQAIAKAHGGSLTVNPDTGLPEAGFLSSILPMIAGVGLTAISGGTLSPVMAGLLTGGATGLATGNLQKGLMAGLGAYGGAGLGTALAGAGTNAATQEAILQANPGLTANEIGREMGTAGFVQPSVQPSMTDKMLAGLKGLGSEGGRDAFMQNIGGAKGLLKSGYAAALPVMMAQSAQENRPPSLSSGTTYSSEYVPGYTGAAPKMDSSEAYFMRPRFIRKADGGETYADGGDTGMTGQSDAYYRYLMGLAPAPLPVAADAPAAASQAVTNPLATVKTPSLYEQALARLTPAELATHNAYLQASRLDNMGPGAPTPAEVNEQAMANALSGVNGSLNPVAQAMSNLAQDLGLTNNPLSIALAVLGAAGGNPLALAPIAAANAAAIDPTNPSSINAQNAMDVGAHPALGFGGANNINAQIGSMGAHASNSPSAPGSVGVAPGSIGEGIVAGLDPAGLAAINEAISSAATSAAASQANAEMNASLGAGSPGAPATGVPAGSIGEGMVDVGNTVGAGSNDPGVGGTVGDDVGIKRGGLASLAAFAQGGYNLGDYSDGGRLLRGPGDGVSDSIPASIADKRPARLADGEFVVPARIVSELGNGSTDAGARRLYEMMDRIQQNRAKTVGKGKVAVNSRSDKHLPA